MDAANEHLSHVVQEATKALIVAIRSDSGESGLAPVGGEFGPSGYAAVRIVAIELDVTLHALEQRLVARGQPLAGDPRQPGGSLMFHFEPIGERLRLEQHLNLEHLEITTLPAGQSTAREHIGIRDTRVAVEQAAQSEYDVEHRRFSNSTRPKQQRQLVERQF